ncbi:hypothetical protein [Streptomyces sp. NPDC048603]|uniref:hypothetical protein n=1 Tax=Streptomyces sp. NPDC048603 TaxID=3365577 RepID=UPI00371ED679
MRPRSLPKPVLAAVLGSLLLSACGTRTAGTDQVPAGSAATASPVAASPTAPPASATPLSGDQQEMRFLDLKMRTLKICDPEDTLRLGSPEMPFRPEDMPGLAGLDPSRDAPGETPPGAPDTSVEVPVPLPSDVPPPPPGPAPTPAKVKEVPLDELETCEGREHAKRIVESFKNTETTGHDVMHKKLTDLGYPTARIHRMPDHAGAPRTRVDLRFMAGYLGLEVTSTANGVTVEPFGIPNTGSESDVTDVERKSDRQASAS